VFGNWQIPVCYNDEFGIDLEFVSKQKSLTKTQIIQRHSQVNYRVFFIGFLPGFLYLGGLDKSLHIPRKSSPRLAVKKGAVAIGGSQTGIYPGVSPGGWNIIGNSPISFFDVTKEQPCFAKAGDFIQFKSVSIEEYRDIKEQVIRGVYKIQQTTRDD
jgi:inhibitor of KinA